MTIGARIKEVRKALGITQGQLAELCHISRSYVAGVEADRYNPSVDTLQKIAAALGTTSGVLMGEAALSPQGEPLPSARGQEAIPHEQYREVLQESGIRILLDADTKVTREDLEDIVEFIKFKQRKNGR